MQEKVAHVDYGSCAMDGTLASAQKQSVVLLRELDQMRLDLRKLLEKEKAGFRVWAEMEATRERLREEAAESQRRMEDEFRKDIIREKREKEELQEELAASIRLREILKEEFRMDLHKVCMILVLCCGAVRSMSCSSQLIQCIVGKVKHGYSM